MCLILAHPIIYRRSVRIGLLQKTAAVGLNRISLCIQPCLAYRNSGITRFIFILYCCIIADSTQRTGRNVHLRLGSACNSSVIQLSGIVQRIVKHIPAVRRVLAQVAQRLGFFDGNSQRAFVQLNRYFTFIHRQPVHGTIFTAGLFIMNFYQRCFL